MSRWMIVVVAMLASFLVGSPAQAAPQTALRAGPTIPFVGAEAVHRHSLAERGSGPASPLARRTRTRESGLTSAVASPETSTLDTGTDTLYVTSSADASVKVIDARRCNARQRDCRPPVASLPGRRLRS